MGEVIDVSFGKGDKKTELPDVLAEVARKHVLKTLEETGFHAGIRDRIAALIANETAQSLRALDEKLRFSVSLSVNAQSAQAAVQQAHSQLCEQFTRQIEVIAHAAQTAIVSAATTSVTVMANADRI